LDLGFNLSGGIRGVFDARGMEYLLVRTMEIFWRRLRNSTGTNRSGVHYTYLYVN